MKNKTNTLRLTVTALLTAVAIAIPIIMPVRLVIEPASFTLASHVPIFLAMFFSPGIAVAVAVGSTIGFLLGGFPIVIVLRAFSHIVFAFVGGIYLQKRRKKVLSSPFESQFFSFWIGLIHGLAETIVVSVFFFYGASPAASYEQGFFYAVFLLVGVGTVVHSMVDFVLAQIIWKAMDKEMERVATEIAK